MKYSLLFTVGAASLLAGCSKNNDFTPAVGMNGEAIFQAACLNWQGRRISAKRCVVVA